MMCNKIINSVGSMKKKSNPPRATAGKQQKPTKTAKRYKPKLSIPAGAAKVASDAEELEKAAGKALAEAEQLFGKSHEVDKEADELHQSIREMRERVQSGGALSRGAGLAAETSAIVVDEKAEADGKPFPIVGIGASAGGFEAFTDFLQAL